MQDGVLPPLNVLLVEGKNDLHVIGNLCKANGIEARQFFEIVGGDDTEGVGYSQLYKEVPRRIRLGDHKRIGIVVDADTPEENHWDSMRELLQRSGYMDIPKLLPSEGLIVVPTVPDSENQERPFVSKIGVWIMPDNSLPGTLEDFVEKLVPGNRAPLWDHAEACVANLPIKPDHLTDNWRAKARIHSYLAWHEEPGTPMGLAITKRYLTGDTEAAQPFMNWLRRLFELDSAS